MLGFWRKWKLEDRHIKKNLRHLNDVGHGQTIYGLTWYSLWTNTINIHIKIKNQNKLLTKILSEQKYCQGHEAQQIPFMIRMNCPTKQSWDKFSSSLISREILQK